jgi:hypothetical protein
MTSVIAGWKDEVQGRGVREREIEKIRRVCTAVKYDKTR